MQRANRIKTIKFTAEDLTADAIEQVNAYWKTPINGTIQRIILDAGNHTATGSMWITESGLTDLRIFTLLSGTARSFGVSASADYYPSRLAAQDILGYAGSTSVSYTSFQPVCKGIIHVAGSALGVGASGLGLTIDYI